MKRLHKGILALMLVMVMVLTIPVGAAAAEYCDEYNVSFVYDGQVVASYENMSYIESVVVPSDAAYWYSAYEKMTVRGGERVYTDFTDREDVVFVAEIDPEVFTVRFVDDDDNVVSEQVITEWDFYWGINIPAGNWMNYDLRLLVNDSDYISGQTLALDYIWYTSHPVLTFYAN